MTVVCEDLAALCRDDRAFKVRIYLGGVDGAAFTDAGTVVGGFEFKVWPQSPEWCCDLPSPDDADFLPQGTVWCRDILPLGGGPGWTNCFTVPEVGGPYAIEDLLTDPPGTVESSALALHTGLDQDHVHGVVEHSWQEDGWTPFDLVQITPGVGGAYSYSVTGDAGLVTGTGPNHDLRIAALHSDMVGSDMEATVLVRPPLNWNGNNVQVGLVGRVRELGGGLWEGVAVWTSVVFGQTFQHLHARPIRFDGTTLFQGEVSPTGDPGGADSSYIDRTLSILNKERITAFGQFFNNHTVVPTSLYGLQAGDIVSIDSTDATFDETDRALNAVGSSPASVQVVETVTTSLSALAIDKGWIRPSGASAMKRWAPFYLSFRLKGDTMGLKRWRPEDPEPDWADPRVTWKTLSVDADVPTVPAGPGRWGLWLAHIYGGNVASFGKLKVKTI